MYNHRCSLNCRMLEYIVMRDPGRNTLNQIDQQLIFTFAFNQAPSFITIVRYKTSLALHILFSLVSSTYY